MMPEAPPNIRAVLFDYGLVLTGPPDPAAWLQLKQICVSEEAAFHAAYWRYRHDYDRGALNSITYWQAVTRELDPKPRRELSPARIDQLRAADTALWTQPNQPMIDWAARLQRAGIRTGILSNLGDAMEDGVRAHCAWLAAFTHHTFSHRLGIAKPEAAIYLHAAAGLAVPPQQILFIDDREDNIAAARAVGMYAVQYTDHPSFLETMTSSGFAALLDPPAQQ